VFSNKKGRNIKVFMNGRQAAFHSTYNEYLVPFRQSVSNAVNAQIRHKTCVHFQIICSLESAGPILLKLTQRTK
jgi:hypothetical protein